MKLPKRGFVTAQQHWSSNVSKKHSTIAPILAFAMLAAWQAVQAADDTQKQRDGARLVLLREHAETIAKSDKAADKQAAIDAFHAIVTDYFLATRVTIMAEGLSLRDAPQRQRLFPTSQLARDMDTGDSTAQIVDEQTFPTTTGGLLRIGGEYMRVVKATGEEWLVKRGAERSVPVAHARGELVEFIPLIDSSAGTAPVDYANLLARNPFAKPTPVVAEPTRVVEEAAPAIDPAEFTYLVAAFVQADKRQAWFYDRLNNQNFVVGTGNPFSVAGIDGVVQAIGNGFILLDHDNSHWRLRLGKNLRSMERVSSATESAQEPSEEG